MTDCPNAEIRDRLPDLVHDSLTGDDRRRVDQHVAECADCSAELALLRRTRAALARHAPRVDTTRIAASVPAWRAAAPRRNHATAWRVAATIGMIAVGTTSYLLIGPERERGVDSLLTNGTAVSSEAPALSFGGRLSTLADEDLDQLLAELDDLDGVMPAEPRAVLPVPVWDGGSQ
jgi:hypothetical protein